MGCKAAVFCPQGLGDGINFFVLSNQLHLNGWHVDTYHNTLGQLQHWLPQLNAIPYSSLSSLPRVLNAYDHYFIAYNEDNPLLLRLMEEGKRRFPDRVHVIYMYPSKNIIHEPYFSDCLTDPELTVAENLRIFCSRILRLPKLTRSSGFIPPLGLIHRKFPKRIVIHPTSSRRTRNWPREKFVKLALCLQEEGYDLSFALGSPLEREEWKEMASLGFSLPEFPTLHPLAEYLYESGFLIGNDSGLGHLASALGIATLTFSRKENFAKMWAPSFSKGIAVYPYSWIPNFRGFRFRDRYWRALISVGRVRRAFERLAVESACQN